MVEVNDLKTTLFKAVFQSEQCFIQGRCSFHRNAVCVYKGEPRNDSKIDKNSNIADVVCLTLSALKSAVRICRLGMPDFLCLEKWLIERDSYKG